MDERDDSMRILRGLEETTEWEQSGDMLSVNDDDDDGGLATVSAGPNLYPIEGDGLGSEVSVNDEVLNQCDVLKGMVESDVIEDVTIVVNTKDGMQQLLSTLQRNDHIIGHLTVAAMNWHSSQISAQNLETEEG